MDFLRIVPTAFLLCFSIYSTPAVADDCSSEEQAAVSEDLDNVISLAEELGIDVTTSGGDAAIETLMAASCSNTKPQWFCVPWHGCFQYCPPPAVACSKGKSCRPTSSGTKCSCQKIVTAAPASEGAVGSNN